MYKFLNKVIIISLIGCSFLYAEYNQLEVGQVGEAGIVIHKYLDNDAWTFIEASFFDSKDEFPWKADRIYSEKNSTDSDGRINTKKNVDIMNDSYTSASSYCNSLITRKNGEPIFVTYLYYRLVLNEKLYSDWYLPSKIELEYLKIIDTLNLINPFDRLSDTPKVYWSSTEESIYTAWRKSFYYDSSSTTLKEVNHRARCIRSYTVSIK